MKMKLLQLEIAKHGAPVIKNPLSNAGDAALIPGQRNNIPRATEQLSPWAVMEEPTCSSASVSQLEKVRVPQWRPSAAKT